MGFPLLDDPRPDFAELARVLRGRQAARRVHLAELLVDEEVMQVVFEKYLGERWIPSDAPPRDHHLRQVVTFYYRMGYDYVPIAQWPRLWLNHPAWRPHLADDTAALSRGKREWADRHGSLISSWEDLETFPWDEIKPDFEAFELVGGFLPQGMKIAACSSVFAHVFEWILGCEGLSYLLVDDPGLVAAVFEHWGQMVLEFYSTVAGMESVGALFHADDLGFRTSTLVSPEVLRRFAFPWFNRYAKVAHECGKMFWCHCCGNIYSTDVIEDLIEDVKIDALHSFQDAILPVESFVARYGQMVAALGGVDVDKLARMDEDDLRRYVRAMLDRCMSGGRFALGSGNSVTNFVPVRNYLIMLEEGRRWMGA